MAGFEKGTAEGIVSSSTISTLQSRVEQNIDIETGVTSVQKGLLLAPESVNQFSDTT